MSFAPLGQFSCDESRIFLKFLVIFLLVMILVMNWILIPGQKEGFLWQSWLLWRCHIRPSSCRRSAGMRRRRLRGRRRHMARSCAGRRRWNRIRSSSRARMRRCMAITSTFHRARRLWGISRRSVARRSRSRRRTTMSSQRHWRMPVRQTIFLPDSSASGSRRSTTAR